MLAEKVKNSATFTADDDMVNSTEESKCLSTIVKSEARVPMSQDMENISSSLSYVMKFCPPAENRDEIKVLFSSFVRFKLSYHFVD